MITEAVATIPARDTPDVWLDTLYREHSAAVFAYVASVLGDQSTAEDVTALAFERALRRRRLYNPRRGSERAWLFGIARNAAIDELRRRRRLSVAAVEPLDPDGSDVTDARIVVRAALAGLEPRDRELILLKFHGELTNAELGRVLGISESNAGTRLHRVLAQLRKACA